MVCVFDIPVSINTFAIKIFMTLVSTVGTSDRKFNGKTLKTS